VGAFISSASHYGTFDQGGNVYEWVDTSGNRNLGRLRGGFWMSNMADMSYVDYYTTSPSYSFDGSGFRLASPVRTNGRSARRNPGFSGDSTDERMDTAFARGSKLGSDHSSTVILAGMAMVAVAQPGNKKDARTGHGSVGYSFNIGNV
jgi:formylglycine-generating enzyme required for sulfatase activity